MKTLLDVMPREFVGGEYHETRSFRYRDVVVKRIHNSGKGWPGPHKNVCKWVELANGFSVAWNENPAIGWSFPVAKKKPATF